jgi:hypothetical protein
MDNRPNGVSRAAPPLKRVAVILKLIGTVLVDCEPHLVKLRTRPTHDGAVVARVGVRDRAAVIAFAASTTSSPHPWHCPLPFPPAVAGPVEP